MGEKKIQFKAQLVLGGNIDLNSNQSDNLYELSPADQRAVGGARNAVVGDESGDPRAR